MDKKDKIFLWSSVLYGGFFLFALYCIFLLVKTQYFENHQEENVAVNNNISERRMIHRGDIISSDNKTLSANIPYYSLFVDFGLKRFKNRTIDSTKVVADKKSKDYKVYDSDAVNGYKEFAVALSKFVGKKSANNYYRMLYNHRTKAENRKNPTAGYSINILDKNIDIFQKDSIFKIPYISKNNKYKTGIYTENRIERINPFGSLAHSAIGTFKNFGNEVSGMEKLYDNELNDKNNIISTIDTKMQDICETILKAKLQDSKNLEAGTIILMETATGNIKAMVNINYDSKTGKYTDTYNNAVKRTVDPGSTFKTVSLMLALETGKITVTDKIDCDEGSKVEKGKKMWNGVTEVKNKKYGELSVSDIIAQSVNIGTAKMVDIAFNHNGNNFIKAIKKTGITDSINMLESPPYITSQSASSWNKNSMYRVAYGYEMRMAPIHILSFYNAIANNGTMIKPRLVNGIKYNTGEEKIFDPEIINKSICSKTTLESVKRVLSKVVSSAGTAGRASGTKYGIAGKTGTAHMLLNNNMYSTNDGRRKVQASFCGFFPEKNPEYTCIVVLYSRLLKNTEDISASEHVVPVFKNVSDKIYVLNTKSQKKYTPAGAKIYQPNLKNTSAENLSVIAKELNISVKAANNKWVSIDTVNNEFKTTEIYVERGIIPNVTGMGLRDAMFLLENMGLRVSYKGIGTVTGQTPEQGSQFKIGQRIKLELK